MNNANTEDSALAPWVPFREGISIGEVGSESGKIVADEEHPEGARITLEQTSRQPFAITCGVYGWMVHTRFLHTEPEAREAYEQMKLRLAQLAASVPYKTDPEYQPKFDRVIDECSRFVEDFP